MVLDSKSEARDENSEETDEEEDDMTEQAPIPPCSVQVRLYDRPVGWGCPQQHR
jgi:hypothetical protein